MSTQSGALQRIDPRRAFAGLLIVELLLFYYAMTHDALIVLGVLTAVGALVIGTSRREWIPIILLGFFLTRFSTTYPKDDFYGFTLGGRNIYTHEIIIAGFFLLWISWLAAPDRARLTRLEKSGMAVIIVLALGAIHGLTRGYGIVNIVFEIRMVVFPAAALIIARCYRPDERSARQVLRVVSAAAVVLAAYCIYIPTQVEYLKPVGEAMRFRMGDEHKNVLSIVAATLCGAAVIDRFRSQWYLLAAVVTMVFAFSSFQRSVYLEIGVLLIAIPFVLRRKEALRFVAGLIAVVILLLPVYLYLAPSAFTIGTEDRISAIGVTDVDMSIFGRYMEYSLSLQAISQSPLFGTGIGSPIQYNLPGSSETIIRYVVHNEYLWLGSKLGIPGLLMVITFPVFAMVRGWALLRRERSVLERIIILLAVEAIVGVMALAIVEDAFHKFSISLLMMFGVGVIAAYDHLDGVRRKDACAPASSS
jgi:hypothetical protein